MAPLGSHIFLLVSLTLVFSGGAACLSMNETGARGDFVISPFKTVVQVFNRLYDANFTIHCKSKNDDLGSSVVGPGGNYRFKFRANFWGTTLFFCGVSWAKGWTVFDIYKTERDIGRCRTYCMWEVLGDGLYGYRQQDKAFHFSPSDAATGNVPGGKMIKGFLQEHAKEEISSVCAPCPGGALFLTGRVSRGMWEAQMCRILLDTSTKKRRNRHEVLKFGFTEPPGSDSLENAHTFGAGMPVKF